MTAYAAVDERPEWWPVSFCRPSPLDALGALVTLHSHRLARGELSFEAANAATRAATCSVASDYYNARGAPNPVPIETVEMASSILGPTALADVFRAADDAGAALAAH